MHGRFHACESLPCTLPPATAKSYVYYNVYYKYTGEGKYYKGLYNIMLVLIIFVSVSDINQVRARTLIFRLTLKRCQSGSGNVEIEIHLYMCAVSMGVWVVVYGART